MWAFKEDYSLVLGISSAENVQQPYYLAHSFHSDENSTGLLGFCLQTDSGRMIIREF